MQTLSSSPLPNARRERFAVLVANGRTLKDAHKLAGFEGKSNTLPARLRYEPDVDARVTALLQERVDASTRIFARRQKKHGDTLQWAIKELEAIASVDPGEIFNWKRVSVLNAAGEVTGERHDVQVQDSAKLSPAARKAIKGVFLKGDNLRVETHDKAAALVSLIKVLTGSDADKPNVTINQVNVGQVSAEDAARRVAFLLAAGRASMDAQPAIKTIEGSAVHNSKDTDGDKTP